MADEKEQEEKRLEVNIDDMDLEDVAEALDKGEIEPPRFVEPTLEESFTSENLEKFIMGEITWAQLQGMTVDEAYNIAEYGYSLYQEARYHDSRAIFEGLIICNPYDDYFHSMLGAVYQQLDMKEEAAQEYTTAIDLDDESLHAYVNRGELLLQNGEFDRALDDLKRAIELDPDNQDPASVRAQALAMATANAIKELQKVAQKLQSEDES
ncbi:MAG: hypothetical protein CMH60_04640 [Myxococcales bacterium]|nr:hypothetical protein [Myxococcales bacterium]